MNLEKKLTKIVCLAFLTSMLFFYNNCTQGFKSNSTIDLTRDFSSEGTLINGVLIKTANCSAADAYEAKNSVLTRISKNFLKYSVFDITGVNIQTWEEYELLPADFKSIKGLSNDGRMQSHQSSDINDYRNLFSKLSKTLVSKKTGPFFSCTDWGTSNDCMDELIEGVFQLAHRGAPNFELLAAIKGNYNAFTSREKVLEFAVFSVFMAPEFLYHLEGLQNSESHEKSLLIANRLASLLWSTSPDKKLLSLAKDKSLLDQSQLAEQVREMIDDDRFSRFYDTFVGGWLSLNNAKQNFENEGKKNVSLINSLINEPKQVFKYIVENDLPINDLLIGNYTILDDNLANYYGLTNSGLNTKSLSDKNRIGILMTPASIAGNSVTTSVASDTSPTHRGYNILKKYFCLPPDPLPANLQDVVGDLKESFAQHSSKKAALAGLQFGTCGGCHKQTDPVGLALENFDSFGHFRTSENGATIDPSGKLVTGAQFQDAIGMMLQFDRSDIYDFENCLTHSLVSYAKKITLNRNNLCLTKEVPVTKSMSFTSLLTEIALSDDFSR